MSLTDEELERDSQACESQAHGVSENAPCYIAIHAFRKLIVQAREANALRSESARLRAELSDAQEALGARDKRMYESKGGIEWLCDYIGDEALTESARKELSALKAKAALADEHASWIRRGPPLDNGNTPHDNDWLARYEALGGSKETA